MIGRLAFWRRDGAQASRTEDCLSCRLVSGSGFLGIGTFLLAQSKKRPQPLENYTMKGLAAAAGILGLALLADASFLKPTVAEPKEEPIKTVKAAKDHDFFARR
ncbi:uncharacterized protein [Drosophila kikkawai]|uniref:Distal membrane-arm assembly complex protein 1-like domain-containing protein n=1 Tax=Drosophila kikkawai TaxID=30033 RepID=A0A6P4I428_DROKI|nr:uncharacterized protein LOC108075664 [Drosophila kikkawai]